MKHSWRQRAALLIRKGRTGPEERLAYHPTVSIHAMEGLPQGSEKHGKCFCLCFFPSEENRCSACGCFALHRTTTQHPQPACATSLKWPHRSWASITPSELKKSSEKEELF
eukprot:c2931_g1_i1 orf=33-365(+)